MCVSERCLMSYAWLFAVIKACEMELKGSWQLTERPLLRHFCWKLNHISPFSLACLFRCFFTARCAYSNAWREHNRTANVCAKAASPYLSS